MLPKAEEIMLKLKKFHDEVLNVDEKLLVNWFIINVLPMVHVASQAKATGIHMHTNLVLLLFIPTM